MLFRFFIVIRNSREFSKLIKNSVLFLRKKQKQQTKTALFNKRDFCLSKKSRDLTPRINSG